MIVDRDEYMALLSSLARIELLIKVLMEAKYGRTEANRVYKEVVETIDSQLKVGDVDEDTKN